MERKPMQVGVTGSSGFLGSHLTNALHQLADFEVTTLKRNSSGKFPKTNELKSFVENLDLIYHVAGVNRGTNEEILKGNIQSTFNLLEAIKKYGKSSLRIIFTSASQVYKKTNLPGKLITETYKTEPGTLYGVAKKTAEDLIRLSGFEYVIMRISNIYGPGCLPNYNSVIATFCHRSVNGECLKIDGNGHQKRDFIYIDDTIQAMILAGIQRGKLVSGIYNIGTGKSRTFNSLASALCSDTNRGEIEYIPFPKDLTKNYQPYTQADMSKLSSKGFKFEPISIEVGVEKYVRCCHFGIWHVAKDMCSFSECFCNVIIMSICNNSCP